MNQIPPADRPREKLQRKGVKALSDFELLEVMIGAAAPREPTSDILRGKSRDYCVAGQITSRLSRLPLSKELAQP
jgi:hypothetical protein